MEIQMREGNVLQVVGKTAQLITSEDKEYNEAFNERLHEWEQKCTKERVPRCRACALAHFSLKANMTEMQMKSEGKTVSEFRRENEFFALSKDFDFLQFEGEDKFTKLAESENRVRVKGTSSKTGENYGVEDVIESIDVNYACKKNKIHKLSINYPYREYEKRFKKVE